MTCRSSMLSVLAVILCLTVFAGCNRSNEGAAPGAAARTAQADPAAQAPLRIISAAPSSSEIIVDLGLGERLVATDLYSQGIPGLPLGLAEIDFFYPDPEAILALAPDIIISGEINMYGAADDPYRILEEMGIKMLYIPTSRSIDDIKRDMRTIAEALGATAQGEVLVRTMEQEIQKVTDIGQRLVSDPAFHRKTVYLEISPFPNPVTMGRETFLDEMIEIIGAQNVFGDNTGWIAPGAEAILERNPEVILTNVNFIDDPLGEIKSRQGFADIAAIRGNQVYLIDTDSSSRPSHRITLALRQMAQAVYPGEYATLGN